MTNTLATEEMPGGVYFYIACIGLGLCIASTEARRYTALWPLETKTSLTLFCIVVFFSVVFGIMIYFARKKPLHLYEKNWALALLLIVQTFGTGVQYLQMNGTTFSYGISFTASVFMETSFLLLVIYANYFLSFGIRRAIEGFAYGIILSGAIQLCVAFMQRTPAFVTVIMLMPLACFLLWYSVRKQKKIESWYATLSEEERVVFSSAVDKHSKVVVSKSKPVLLRKGSLGHLYLTIFLIMIILIGVHNQWAQTQDSGTTSFLIQISAGVGTILAGNIILLIRQYLQEQNAVDFCRSFILPVALGALYLATLFYGPMVSISVIPLNVAHVLQLLLIWVVPFVYRTEQPPFYLCCMSFFVYKLGWAAGVLGIMILPGESYDWVGTAFITVSFILLVILSLVLFLKNRSDQNLEALDDAIDVSVNKNDAFIRACQKVSDQYRLTPREREVFTLLARGRTAGYISKSLTISDGTARTHIMHIYQKMNVRSQQVLMDEVEVATDGILHGTSET